MKMYVIMFDSYDVINKKYTEKEKIFGVEIYNENSVHDMMNKIKEMYSDDQVFEYNGESLKVHVFYGNDLYFYIKALNVVRELQ